MTGRRQILVVEDEPLIGMDIETTLEDAGFDVLGPATSVADALSLLERHGCDAAILDVNLVGETSEPVAERLAAKGVPFITFSGHAKDQAPAVFRASIFLAKPALPEELLAAVDSLLPPRQERAG